MLTEFDQALTKFKEVKFPELQEAIKIDPGLKVFIQVQSLGVDLIQLSSVARDVHIVAVTETSNGFDAEIGMAGHNFKVPAAHEKLGAVLKSTFFSARAYQDEIYKFGLLASGQRAGPGSSMAKALDAVGNFNVANPLGGLLAEKLPAYAGWFFDMRYSRNAIKYGTGVA